MKRLPLDSKALKSWGYDADKKILELEFREGGEVWQYADFPESMLRKFMNAESKGRFFVKEIKGLFPEEKQ